MTRRGPKYKVTPEKFAAGRDAVARGVPLKVAIIEAGVSPSSWFRAVKRLGAK